MNTVELQQWQEQFCEIMAGDMPEPLKMDKLKALHDEMTEETGMFEEPAEHETRRLM